MIPITTVRFGEDEERLVTDVLRSGAIAQGPLVARFEAEFAAMHQAKHAVAVNNGTTALIAALQVLDLQPGDEVLTSPFTFVATINAALEAGATVTFADIRDDDFNLDPASVSARATDRTRVILPVHLYGQMADMDPIAEIAAARGATILEDSAQSHGATYRGRFAGSYGLGTFSFYATKNITTGEGGMITTDDDRLADRLRVLRNQGMRARYEYEMAGNNYRMTDLQAAIGIPQLSSYDRLVDRRSAHSTMLSELLSDVAGIVLPRQLEDRRHVWHQYTIRITDEAGVTRDDFVERLADRGVGSGVYYPRLLWDYAAYQGRPDVQISTAPVAARVAREVVSLPVHHWLTEDEVVTVAKAVISALVPA